MAEAAPSPTKEPPSDEAPDAAMPGIQLDAADEDTRDPTSLLPASDEDEKPGQVTPSSSSSISRKRKKGDDHDASNERPHALDVSSINCPIYC